MSISVVVITWNQVDILTKCLRSVTNGFDFDRHELIVVDNGSTDNTNEIVSKNFPQAKYIYLKKNIGVGPARNRGIMASTKNFIMTLDNDAYLTTPFLTLAQSIERSFEQIDNLGVMGFRLCYPNGDYQHNGRQFPHIVQPFSSRFSVLRKFNFFRNLHAKHLRSDLDNKTQGLHEVDYVLGANQIFSRRTAVYTGIYNESIFYGPEDLEFCWSVQRTGYVNMVNMDFTILHDYQRRSSKSIKLLLKHTVAFYKSWARMNLTYQSI